MKLPIANNRTIVRKTLALFGKFKAEFSLVLAIQMVVALSAIVMPFVIGRTINQVAEGTSRDSVMVSIYIIIATVIIASVFGWLAELRSRTLGQKMFSVLRVDLVNSVIHMPLSTVEAAGTGDLLGRSTSDVRRVEFVVRMGISRILMLSLTVIVTIIAAVFVDWKVGGVVLLVLYPYWRVLRKYLRRSIQAYLAESAVYAEFSGEIAETVEQGATVDSLQMGELRRKRADVMFKEMWTSERYTALMRSLFMLVSNILMIMPVLLAVLWGAFLIGQGYTSVGAVVAVALYAQQLQPSLDELGWWVDELQYAQVALARIFGVAEVEPDRVPGTDVPDGEEIKVSDVSFAYRDGVEVLRDVDLDVRPGERLAIVGPSGAGKSTLGRLLAGTNPPGSGSVTIGGVEVTKLAESELHKAVALVTQENHVFVGTIADNLRLANKDADDDALRAALAAVDATWVWELESGMETKVGSGEKELQPAQAQQIALARIVLLDPSVIVLDEATSLLDPTAARSLERALSRVLEGRTVISIAHRLYTAYDADRVAVMIDGEVKELGPHEELVAAGGEYASLWETWQRD